MKLGFGVEKHQIDTAIFDGRDQTCIQNKYAKSLQYLKKEMSDEVDFLHADKH